MEKWTELKGEVQVNLRTDFVGLLSGGPRKKAAQLKRLAPKCPREASGEAILEIRLVSFFLSHFFSLSIPIL